jgi:L-iditol 2-dehydrogenase
LQDTVVVMGAGPIGCLHIAVARARGARVILSEPSQTRRELALGFQPELVVDPAAEDLVGIVRAATGGTGADIAICANPVAATHTQAIELVRKRGKVVLFGGLPKANPLTTLDANRIHYGEIEVLGTFLSPHLPCPAWALRRRLAPADRLITHSFRLPRWTAFLSAASGEALKVMVSMD